MRMIITSILLILFHQLFTRVAVVSSQSTENNCTQNSMAVEDQGSAYSGVKMYFGDSFCQRIIQQDVTNAMKNACTGMTTSERPSDEYKAQTTKIDSLDKKVDDALQRLTLIQCKPTCPKGYEYYQHDKFCYKFHSECKTWTEARLACRQEGGDLISLNENNFEFFRNVSQSKAGNCNDVWVGTTDMDSEGKWNWLNGEIVASAFWGEGQPNNNLNQQHCAMISSYHEFRLNDYYCIEEVHFICQIVRNH